jgi:hypothetical protein
MLRAGASQLGQVYQSAEMRAARTRPGKLFACGRSTRENLVELLHGHGGVMGKKSFHEIHRPCFARMGAPLDGILRLE